MRGKQTIIINGRNYDALTGMPVDESVKATVHHVAEQTPVTVKVSRDPAKHLTHKQHHSTTLRRDIVKKPAGQHDSAATQHKSHAHVTRSTQISKFAPHPLMQSSDKQPEQVHHVVTAAHAKVAAKHQPKPAVLSSRELKDRLIKQQLAQAPAHRSTPKKKRAPLRVSSVMAACLGLMILGGYLSYINMPNLSVRVAAAQAGVNAKYPGYTPSGYRFDGPVAYSNGTVSLAFAANGGTASYEINQKKSNWDSQAVLDNFVVAQSDQYSVNDIQGLTIYTYENNAAWVNRGVLYTISGNAPLRTDQVLKIATSL